MDKCTGECSKCNHMCIWSPFYEQKSENDLGWSIQALRDDEMM